MRQMLVELALVKQDSRNASVFFHLSVAKRGVCSQMFLVETGGKNRDDFHCIQMSLVMSMQLKSRPFIFMSLCMRIKK